VSSSLPAVRAFGSGSDSAAAVIAFNDYKDLASTQSIRPGFGNLPFSGAVTVERYLIDTGTSNVAKYIDAGQVPNLADSSLTMVESYQASVDQGKLLLDARTLGPAAVTMWVVRRN
jgi:hypothetical protein